MYGGMKKAFGPNAIKVAPLKSASGDIITDRGRKEQCLRTCVMPASCYWLQTCKKACPSIHRRLQTRSEGRRHQPSRLGGCSCRPRQLEANHQNRDPDKREEEKRPVGRSERAQTTEKDSNSTYRAKHGHVHLSKLQQSLSIKNRTVQSQQALQLNQTLTSWRIFHCLQRQKDADVCKTLFFALFSTEYSWYFLSSPSSTIQAFSVVPAFCLSLVRKVSSKATKRESKEGIIYGMIMVLGQVHFLTELHHI